MRWLIVLIGCGSLWGAWHFYAEAQRLRAQPALFFWFPHLGSQVAGLERRALFFGIVGVGILLAMLPVITKSLQKPVQRAVQASLLDTVLLHWTPDDTFTVRDLLNGGVCITGRAGSGKTSSSGKTIARAVVAYPKSGGLLLAAKPEDAEMWQKIFEEVGRKDDLLVFGPESPLRFNFISYVLKSGGHTGDVTKCIMTIGETLRSSDAKGGEDSDFWEKQNERVIYNAVEALRQAFGEVTAPEIQKFISGAAMSSQQLTSAQWKAGFHNLTLAAAFKKNKTEIEAHDNQLLNDFWLIEFPNMADKTRSSILTGVMGILHTYNTGFVREIISTTTNISPDDMLKGKWILVNMSPAEWGDMGNFVCAGWKYLTQKRILRRKAEDGDFINVIWCDEAQQFVNNFDSHYLAQCRSHMGAMIYLTQSKHSYYSVLHGDKGRAQADALLTNFHTKIFHALGDVESATWAADLIGRERQTFVGSSLAPFESLWDEVRGIHKVTTSSSEHYEKRLQDDVFINGLRTGGAINDCICDAYVVRSGEPFSSGENYLRVAFSQR